MAKLQQFSALQSIGAFQVGQADKEKRDRRKLLQEVGGQAAAGDFGGAQKTALEAGAFDIASEVSKMTPDRKAETAAFFDDVIRGITAVDTPEEMEQLKRITLQKYPGLANDPAIAGRIANLTLENKDILLAQARSVQETLTGQRLSETASAQNLEAMVDARGNVHTLDLTKPGDRKFAQDNNLRPAPSRQVVTPDPGAFIGAAAPTAVLSAALKTIDESDVTLGIISDFRDVLTTESVGVVGAVRRIAQGAAEQAKAFAPVLDAQRNEILNDIVDTGSDVNTALFTIDESLAQAELLENVLAYRFAKTMDPSGRVAKDDLKAAQTALGSNKFLTGEVSIGAKLDAFEKMVNRQRAVASRRAAQEQPQAPRQQQDGGEAAAQARLDELLDQGLSRSAALQQMVTEGF